MSVFDGLKPACVWKHFEAICRKRGVPYDPDMVEYLIDKHYRSVNRPFAACQPRDLLDQVIDMANYLGIPPQLNPVLLDRAVRSYFVRFDKDKGASERTTMASIK